MITKEQITELAGYYKIDEATILREYLQLMFLNSFYSLKQSKDVFFKGGTAIHFHYNSFRFSEDLDFTAHLPSSLIEEMIRKTLDNLQTEIKDLELGKITHKKSCFSGLLRLKYKGGHFLTVRLEFSLREKALSRETSLIESRFPLTGYPLVVHLSAEELLAEKVRAIMTRSKGRDFFDLWYLLSKDIPLRTDYIEEKMKWCKKEFDKETFKKKIYNLEEKDLYNDLAKFLPQNYRKTMHGLKDLLLKKNELV